MEKFPTKTLLRLVTAALAVLLCSLSVTADTSDAETSEEIGVAEMDVDATMFPANLPKPCIRLI